MTVGGTSPHLVIQVAVDVVPMRDDVIVDQQLFGQAHRERSVAMHTPESLIQIDDPRLGSENPGESVPHFGSRIPDKRPGGASF